MYSLTASNNTVFSLIAFQVISEESKSSNLFVLLKDVEKSFTKCRESLINDLPPGVLIIGSHTQAQSYKDQVCLHTFEEAQVFKIKECSR